MDFVKSNRIHCNVCNKTTQHTKKGEYVQECSGEIETTENVHQILECDQCRSVSFRQFAHLSEFQEYPGDLDPEGALYPPRTRRQRPEWLTTDWIGESRIYNLLQEFYKALDANIHWLASIGARTIFDVFAVNAIGDVGRFDEKLDELTSNGIITKTEREHLEALVTAGGASAHRGYHPSDHDMNVIADILEATIYKHFVAPKKLHATNKSIQLLKQNTPRRPACVKKSEKPRSKIVQD